MKKIYLMFLMGVLLLGVTTAFVFKQNEVEDLRVVCYNNGFCSGTSYCNVSVLYPNQSILIDNQQMTNQNSFHNYSFGANNLNALGEYRVSGFCEDNSVFQEIDFTFDVTSNGEPPISNNFIIIFVLGFLLLSSIVVTSFMWIMNKFVDLNVTINDIVMSFATYGLYLAYYYFAFNYWGNPVVMDLLEVFLWVFGFLNLFVVPVLLLITIIKNWGEQPL